MGIIILENSDFFSVCMSRGGGGCWGEVWPKGVRGAAAQKGMAVCVCVFHYYVIPTRNFYRKFSFHFWKNANTESSIF